MYIELENNGRDIEKWNPTAVVRRFGLAGFTFFFAKGMLWLSLPILAKFLWSA